MYQCRFGGRLGEERKCRFPKGWLIDYMSAKSNGKIELKGARRQGRGHATATIYGCSRWGLCLAWSGISHSVITFGGCVSFFFPNGSRVGNNDRSPDPKSPRTKM
jgi:hypothetical protein